MEDLNHLIDVSVFIVEKLASTARISSKTTLILGVLQQKA
jgi:hypothetical protein